MRIALVNLPHDVPVVRRYMCSYNSPIFLFPPLELLSVAAVARTWGKDETMVIDAIAERLSANQTLAQLRQFEPELVITITSFEIFEQDMRTFAWLREALPRVKFAAFGHYATIFPNEVMAIANLDYVFRGEPEYTFFELTEALKQNAPLEAIQGLTYRRDDGSVISNPDRPRTRHVDELPFPDYSLVDVHHYSEFLLPKPFVVLQTARGCPYTCNFCVRSYGQKLGMRTPDNIIDELRDLVRQFKIRSFRFIDDTFTAIPARTSEICEKIQQRLPKLVWSCLSRVDTMDQERAKALKQGGCRRVYLGIESGSQRILRLYGKDYGIERIHDVVAMLRRNRIEVAAFFMVGHPEETQDDFEQTSRLVRSLALDYSTVGQTVPYPGTSLFDQYRDQVDFSLFPYKNEWKSPGRRDELHRWESRFFRDAYLQLPYLARHAMRFMRYPLTTLAAGKALVPYFLGVGQHTTRSELV
jgi:radical SAM superfamily enzyme YgiQ (UPF0313 family)